MSLESLTRRSVGSRSRMTQAATTGPARQPRPTSSVPAMARKPKSRSRRSTTDSSATRANSANRRPTKRSSEEGFLAFTAFFDAGGFPAEIPEIVEVRAADPAMTFHLDLVDRRRIQREHTLHTDPAGNLADCEHLARASPAAGEV